MTKVTDKMVNAACDEMIDQGVAIGSMRLYAVMRSAIEAALREPVGAWELVDRIHKSADDCEFTKRATLLREAADAIEELVEALKPFAMYAADRDNNPTTAGYENECPLAYATDRPNKGAATVGDLRRARALLARMGVNL